MKFDTTFYDERIAWYTHYINLNKLVQTQGCRHKGFGPIEFTLDLEGVNWILNFWMEAREWFIKKEQERIAREEGKKTRYRYWES